MIFYRNIVAAALEIAPDETMRAIADEVIGFEMPGATMAGFRRSSMLIAKAGIYDLRLHHDEVIMPVLRQWDVFGRSGLGPVGEQAREELGTFLTALDEQATAFVDRRAEQRARQAATSEEPQVIVS
jgi:acyl-[acyl-carrier-protein] desaturase